MIDQEQLERIVEFHGHMCPGLAMGVRAADVALEEIGPHSTDEEVVAIVETDMCAIDAIQFVTGCTFGKGNLIHRDYGKSAFTFVRRSDARAIRVSLRSGAWGSDNDEWISLIAKLQDGTATADEHQRIAELQQRRSDRILASSAADLYEVREISVEVPPVARLLPSVDCDQCQEPTMQTRIRRLGDKSLCLPCFERAMSGDGEVTPPGGAERGACACASDTEAPAW